MCWMVAHRLDDNLSDGPHFLVSETLSRKSPPPQTPSEVYAKDAE